MIEMRWVRYAAVTLVCVVVLYISPSQLWLTSATSRAEAGCRRDNFSVSISPDNQWHAFLSEENCADGGFVTTATFIVQLVRRGDDPNLARNTARGPEGDVFAMEWFSANDRPALEWLSSRQLQITAPHKSFIGLQKQEYDGIRIVVRFDPNDPAARQKRFKDRGLK